MSDEASGPPNLQALLAQLGQSTAWQTATSSNISNSATIEPETAPATVSSAAERSETSSSVSALLAKLQSSSSSSLHTPAFPPAAPTSNAYAYTPEDHRFEPSIHATFSHVSNSNTNVHNTPSPAPHIGLEVEVTQSPGPVTYQRALPIIANLSDNPDFIQALRKLKREQADEENKLWANRLAVIKQQEARVKVARTKAQLTGSNGLTPHDAQLLAASFERELKDYDLRTVLPALDGLRARHREVLKGLGVPVVGLGDEAKVMQVLEGLVDV